MGNFCFTSNVSKREEAKEQLKQSANVLVDHKFTVLKNHFAKTDSYDQKKHLATSVEILNDKTITVTFYARDTFGHKYCTYQLSHRNTTQMTVIDIAATYKDQYIGELLLYTFECILDVVTQHFNAMIVYHPESYEVNLMYRVYNGNEYVKLMHFTDNVSNYISYHNTLE